MNPFFTTEVLRRLKATRSDKDPQSKSPTHGLPRWIITGAIIIVIALAVIIIRHFIRVL